MLLKVDFFISTSRVKGNLLLFELLFDYSGLLLFFLALYLGASDMVVGEIALLAHSHGVEEPVSMSTFRCVYLAAEALVARRTHVLGVVLPIGMGAVSYRFRGVLRLQFLQHWRLVLGEGVLV